RTLAPWSAAIEPDIAKRGLGRFVEARMIIAEILGRQYAAILLLKFDDGARNVAAIEGVARGIEAGLPPARTNGCFLVRHVLQGSGERLLHEHLACLRRPSFWQIEIDIGRKLPVLRFMLGNDFGHKRVDRKSIARIIDCRLRNLSEAHGAEARERGDP